MVGWGERTAVRNVAGCEDFIGKLSTSFEGKLFGEDKRVVTIKEEGGNLLVLLASFKFFIRFPLTSHST